MPGEYPNCYQRARKPAGLSQERAAEALDLSPESLKAYETNLRVPPHATVVRMCEVYDAPWLALEHLRNTSGMLGVLPEDITVQALPTAAIALINCVLDFAEDHKDRLLLRIAEDGVIDEAEQADFDEIVSGLDKIIRAALQVKFVRLPHEERQKTKKDRLAAGTAKRFVPGLSTENDCKNIIPHLGENTRPNFKRGGGDSL